MVERTLIRPPASQIGPLRPDERSAVMADSPVRGMYDRMVERESAYEMLAAAAKRAEATRAEEDARKAAEERAAAEAKAAQGGASRRRSDTPMEAAVKSVTRSIASSVGRQIAQSLIRGVLGSLSRR